MKHKRSIICLLSSVVAVVLACAILISSFGTVVGNIYSYGSKYISEVRIFSADSISAAIDNCKKAGFIPVEKNLNHAKDGDIKDNGIYVIGYKTTDNPDEGITDISLLQMNNGYQNHTYGEIAERAIEKLGNVPDELDSSVKEFVENYNNGSPAAKAAVSALNCYYIEERNNQKLGDYLVSGECTVDFIKKLMARSSTAVVSAFCNALVAGVAEYGDENWATRLSNSTEIREQINDDANYKKLDVAYKDYASELVESIHTFSKAFHEADERYKKNHNKIDLSGLDEAGETEITEETVEDMTNGGEIQKEDGDTFYLYAYEVLNKYDYDESTKLGDYFVNLGDMSFDKIENLRKIYPLVESLTDGQVATMRLSGIASSAIYLINEEGISETAKEQIDAIKAEIKENTGKDSLSIWAGTDQTIYNQSVAVTTNAIRANSAGQIYNTLTSPDSVDVFLSEAMSKLEIIMTVIGIGYGITFIAASTIGYMSAFAVGSIGVSASIWAVCCAGIGAGVFGTLFGIMGCAFVILNYVALVAMVIILIAMFIKWLYDKFTDDDAEDFTEIPGVIFDMANSRYVKYQAITDGKNPVNINGSNARRWNALYYTKSNDAGNPICSADVNDLICVNYDNNTIPTGYKPVKTFGEVLTANLNANSKSDSASVFMFCKITANAINEGKEEINNNDNNDNNSKTQYLSKLSLSVSNSETAAKTALTKSGLKVLDVNLTPAAKEADKYTYLGFDVTTNPDDAITDIRISAKNSSEVYMFGNASYASCGTTPVGDTLYYTSYKSAGSPILADIAVRNSLDDVPKGYEPINLFCGGNAYNLNVGADLDNSISMSHTSQSHEHWGDKGTYLYFKPSVSYTEGTEYISGIVLVAGTNIKNTDTATDFINALKLKKFNEDANLTCNSKIQLPSTDAGGFSIENWTHATDTYICYTTTYNPYRAIYGIRSYTSAPGNCNVPAFLGSISNGAYGVCEVMFELDHSAEASPEFLMRGVYASHSYQFANTSGEKTGIIQEDITIDLAPEDYENVSWSSCGARGKGIYVLGPTEGGTPLTLNDVVVSSSSETPDGFVSVQDFKTPNRTEPHNLGYSVTDSKYVMKGKSTIPVYIYQRQEKPVEKKYISSIHVSTYTLEKATGGATNLSEEAKAYVNRVRTDFCIQNLLAQCTDEIVPANIAIDDSERNKIKDRASYIGVSRTDSESKAITGIIRYVTDKKDVPASIQVSGVNYIKAGDMIYDTNGSYYLYYTTSAGSNPGLPITSISASSEVFAEDCATAMSTKSTDVKEIKVGSEVTRAGEKATLFGDSKCSTFIHMSYADTATMIGAIYVGHGLTKKEAQCNLLSLGCNMCVDMDVNKGTGGEYVYIGYTKYTLLASEIKKGVAKYAVRDIVLTVGEEHQKELVIDGIKYRSAIDEYTNVKNYDGKNAVSLNAGTGGKKIYLYYTTTMTSETAYPISRLGLALKDYGMQNSENTAWEHVYDINGNRVNLNERALATKDDGNHIVDNRIYMYVSRVNNYVREDYAVDMSTINKEYISYDIYMKGA